MKEGINCLIYKEISFKFLSAGHNTVFLAEACVKEQFIVLTELKWTLAGV
jgi:hypothetical protein